MDDVVLVRLRYRDRAVALVSDNLDQEHPRVADPGDEGECACSEDPVEASS
jgi:hypothetical protein